MYGVPAVGTGVGGHIANICKHLPENMKAEMISDRFLRRQEVWAFEPIPTLLFAMSQSRHNLIHSHNEVALLQRMKSRRKTVTTVHLHPQRVIEEYLTEASLSHISFNPLFLSKLLINRAQWDRMLKVSDRVIATCRQHITLLSNLHDIPLERFHYIPNGVDTTTFSPKIMKKEFQCLFVGDWSWRKGARYLLDAFKIATNELPNLKLSVVAKDYPGNNEFADSNLRKNLSIFRRVSETQLIELYNTSSFLVLPSLAEASPLVMLESMSCGIPVVAFSVDGIPELIINGVNGILVEKRDVNGLAKAMLKLAEDYGYAEALGTEARKTALKHGWSQIASETAQVYQEVLEGVPESS
jgi:glycosyltransferase involved in cell wall biosynthesis